uniref:AMP-binding enzyme C-terminal domain-containing protein n=1 Tax=Calcidiscus leptoporus TaxID=127549 RepID=A0A7S0J1F4_9EUKA
MKNSSDDALDFYWLSRDSALLIRGGANYSYEQINAELATFVSAEYGLAAEGVAVAVVGLRLRSEHEDECCVTIELGTPEAQAKRAEIEQTFLGQAKKRVSKGAKPDRLRIAKLPRNFKGAIQLPDLKAAWAAEVSVG